MKIMPRACVCWDGTGRGGGCWLAARRRGGWVEQVEKQRQERQWLTLQRSSLDSRNSSEQHRLLATKGMRCCKGGGGVVSEVLSCDCAGARATAREKDGVGGRREEWVFCSLEGVLCAGGGGGGDADG